VDNKRHSDNGEEEDEDEEDEEKEEEEEEEEEDGKEPETIGQGEIVNTSAKDANTMVDDMQISLSEQGRELHTLTLRPQPLEPAP
jgi:hypothetical protein